MDEEEFVGKLLTVLKKITGTDGKSLDTTILDKLFSSIRYECDSHSKYEEYLRVSEILQWLSEDVRQLWKLKGLTFPSSSFIIQFMSIMIKNEDGFKAVQKTNVLDEMIKNFNSMEEQNYCLKIVFLKFLNDTLNHQLGYKWVISQKIWSLVNNWFFSNTNFYVEQECFIFYRNLFKKIDPQDDLLEEILYNITAPIIKNKITATSLNNHPSDSKKCFKLLLGILRLFIFHNFSAIQAKLSKIFNIEKELNFILEECNKEDTLEIASCLYILYQTLKFNVKSHLLILDYVFPYYLNIFTLLLQKNEINCIIKLSKFCQLLWNEIIANLKCENTVDLYFIIIQLIPVCALNADFESKIIDSSDQNHLNFANESAFQFVNAFKDKLRNQNETQKWALKGVFSVTNNINCLKKAQAGVIFQLMTDVLLFATSSNTNDDKILRIYDNSNSALDEEYEGLKNVNLLSAIINLLCLLLEKFEINLMDYFRIPCFFKMICNLIRNTSASCSLMVRTLSFIKFALLRFLLSSQDFLYEETKNSSLQCFLLLIYERLHDINWEVRDSSLEVVTTIIQLAESKYVPLQNLLIEKNFFILVCDIMEGDSESYVRASALKALSSAVKIEIFKPHFNKMNLPSKIIFLFNTESEGIVRREAVLLLTQVYLHLDVRPEFLSSIYEIMGYAALSDLHWEVKMNSLIFWEAAMRRIFLVQGIVEESFQKIIPEENDNTCMISDIEMKTRLNQALVKLSEIGFLHVLLKTLDDDCDYQVVLKSTEIITYLLSFLKRFHVCEKKNDLDDVNKMPFKRKYHDEKPDENDGKLLCKEMENENKTDVNNIEKCPPTDPDAVIEEIVNEMDINLLVNVHRRQNINEAQCLRKKVTLEKIKPEVFLMQMQDFDSKSFLCNKKKWLINANPNLESLINDIMLMNSHSETNIMDCY